MLITSSEKSATLSELSLLQVLRRVSVSCQNDNTKEQQGNATVSQTDRMEKMSHTTLADEVTCFFGAVKTKRSNTVKSKIADYVKKDQLKKLIFFQSLQGKWWSGQGNKIVLE